MRTVKTTIAWALGLMLTFGFSACSESDEPITKGFNDEVLPALPQKKKAIEKEKLCNLFETSTPVYLETKKGSFLIYDCRLGDESKKNQWNSDGILNGAGSPFPEDAFIQDGKLSMNVLQPNPSMWHPLAGAWKRYCHDLGHTVNVYHTLPTFFNTEDMTIEVRLISNYGTPFNVKYVVNGFSNNELSLYNLNRCASYDNTGAQVSPTYFLHYGAYETSKELKKDNGRDYYFDNDREARDFMLRTLREKYGRFVPKVIVNSIPDEKEIDLDKVEKELAEWPSVWD